MNVEHIRVLEPGLLQLVCHGDTEVYCDATDLENRERTTKGWRVHDRDDCSIPLDGPLWVHMTDDQVEEARRLVSQ